MPPHTVLVELLTVSSIGVSGSKRWPIIPAPSDKSAICVPAEIRTVEDVDVVELKALQNSLNSVEDVLRPHTSSQHEHGAKEVASACQHAPYG